MNHITFDGVAVACNRAAGLGRCRLCELLDPAHPDHDPDFLRIYPGDPAPMPAAPGPGLLRKAVNFGQAVVEHVAAGLPTACDATIQERLAACMTCEHYLGTSCRLCGCNIPAKVRWLEQRCPIGKW